MTWQFFCKILQYKISSSEGLRKQIEHIFNNAVYNLTLIILNDTIATHRFSLNTCTLWCYFWIFGRVTKFGAVSTKSEVTLFLCCALQICSMLGS